MMDFHKDAPKRDEQGRPVPAEETVRARAERVLGGHTARRRNMSGGDLQCDCGWIGTRNKWSRHVVTALADEGLLADPELAGMLDRTEKQIHEDGGYIEQITDLQERAEKAEVRVEYVTQLNTEKAEHVRGLQADLRRAEARIAEVAAVAEERGYDLAALREAEAALAEAEQRGAQKVLDAVEAMESETGGDWYDIVAAARKAAGVTP